MFKHIVFVQIVEAFSHLVKYNDSLERDVRFAISCHSNNAKGIHLRGHDVSKAAEVPVKVTPVFLNDKEPELGESKVKFNMKFALTCDAAWVKHPEFLDLMYVTRRFLISIHSSGLTVGVHSTYVRAFDTAHPDKGTVFEVPVTVVVPEPLTVEGMRPTLTSPVPSVTFKPNQIQRHFVKVPEKATWAVIKVKSHEAGRSGEFYVHTVQLLHKTIVKMFENHKIFTLNELGEFKMGIAVKG